MADLHITRGHSLGLAEARKLAVKWAETAQEQLAMEYVYEEGKTVDHVSFKRAGARGQLKVTKDQFVLHARLGLLLGAFKHRIETEIVRNLDVLLAHEEPLAAFEHAVAKRVAARKTHHRKKG